MHIRPDFIYAVDEAGWIFETELYALCGMLCAGNLGQTAEKISAPQEAEAEGTGCQQLATGQTRLEQGLSAFLLLVAMAQVDCTIYFQEEKENPVSLLDTFQERSKNYSYWARCSTQQHRISSCSLSWKLNG